MVLSTNFAEIVFVSGKKCSLCEEIRLKNPTIEQHQQTAAEFVDSGWCEKKSASSLLIGCGWGVSVSSEKKKLHVLKKITLISGERRLVMDKNNRKMIFSANCLLRKIVAI